MLRRNRKVESRNISRLKTPFTSRLLRRKGSSRQAPLSNEHLSNKGLHVVNEKQETTTSSKGKLKTSSAGKPSRAVKRSNSAGVSIFPLSKAKSFASKSMQNLKHLVTFEASADNESEEEYEFKDSEFRVKRNSVQLSDIEEVPEPTVENAASIEKLERHSGSFMFRKAFLASASSSFENDKNEMNNFIRRRSKDNTSSDSDKDTITLSSSSDEDELKKTVAAPLQITRKKKEDSFSDFFEDTSESLLDV